MSLDPGLAKALHVEILRKQDLHAEHEPHVVFQTSTIDALLDGAYDGEVTVGELSEHGDFGLGTFDACDGEMVLLDGACFRAAADGTVAPVPPSERTPFAVVTFFEPDTGVRIEEPLDQQELLTLIDSHLPPSSGCQAVRIDGRFGRMKVRSVPRQEKPYPPLAEVATHQHVYVLEDVQGTVVGFRFPDYAEGIEVTGYHLHFISDDRTRGGHVLDCRVLSGVLAVEGASELHLELPAGVDPEAPQAAAGRRELLDRIEGDS